MAQVKLEAHPGHYGGNGVAFKFNASKTSFGSLHARSPHLAVP
jgi:hypothetical protein